jgi:2-oxoglutarate dehydrogenase E2 component (dihydrolipoamide succinyltransferase)
MAIEVPLPQLGESVVEGTVTKWLVKEGDAVAKDQPLVEIATDKADSEIPSPEAGVVTKLLVPTGATIAVKTALCLIEVGATAAAQASQPLPPVAAVVAQPVATPHAAAAASAFGGALASPETRQLAREHGVDLATIAGSGEHGRVPRDDVLRVAQAPASTPLAPVAATAPVAQPAPAPVGRTGNAGELQALMNAALAEGKAVYVPPIPNVGFGAFKVPPYVAKPGDTVLPFSRRRRLTAAHMVYSKNVAPQVVTVAEIDMWRTAKLRDAHKDRYKKQGIGLTYLAFVVHATAIALKENPSLNARVLDDAVVLLRDINVGVAVDTKDGLVVPVIRRCDTLNVRGVAMAIDDAAGKARDGKLTPDDLSSASFSVSNPGLKGNLFGGAIINQPNVGILRIGELKKRPVVVEQDGADAIVIHPVMYMALSYDHRVVDGVAANSFLWRVRDLLEKGEFEV